MAETGGGGPETGGGGPAVAPAAPAAVTSLDAADTTAKVKVQVPAPDSAPSSSDSAAHELENAVLPQARAEAAERDAKSAEAVNTNGDRKVKVPDRVANDPRFQAIQGELYATAKQQGEVNLPNVMEQALANYYKDLAGDLIQKGVLEAVTKDPMYQQELGKLVANSNEGEAVDKGKLAEQALANYLQAKDLEIANERDPNKKESLLALLAKIVGLAVLSTVTEAAKTIIPPSR